MKKHLQNIEKEVTQIFVQNLQPKGEYTYVSFTKKITEILSSSKDFEFFNASIQKIDPSQIFCGANIKFGELSFECFDCACDENALLCSSCFKASNHENHRIRYSTRKAGYCDCGDGSMIKIEACCQNHRKPSMLIEEEANSNKQARDFELIATVLLESLFLNIVSISESLEVSLRGDKKLTKLAINNLASHSLKYISSQFKGDHGSNLIRNVLVNKFLNVESSKILKHDCSNLELILIKSGKDSKACNCLVLEALIRSCFSFEVNIASELKNMLHKLLPKWEFKLVFVETYAKLFEVIFGGKREMGGELRISPFYAFYNYFSNEALVEKLLNSFDFLNKLINVTGDAIDAFFSIYYIAAYNGFNEIKKIYFFLIKYKAFSSHLKQTDFLERFLEVIYKSHEPSVHIEEDNEKCRLHIECSLLVMFRNMLGVVYQWNEHDRTNKFESLFHLSLSLIEKSNSSESISKLQNAWPLHSTLERSFTILLSTMLSYKPLSDIRLLFLSSLDENEEVLQSLFKIFMEKITRALRFCKKIVKRANTNELFDNPVESIKREVINGFYKKSYYLQYDYDMALYQIILCLTPPQQVLSFFMQTYGLELKQIYFKTSDPSYLQALSEALNSTVILLSDETPYMNSIAYLKILTKPQNSVLSEYLKENLKALMISALHLPKTTDLKGVKHLLFNKIINFDVEIEGVLEEVATFNKENKSFKLRPEFSEIFEPYTFHKYPKLTSELYESIKLLSVKNPELDTIIGKPLQRTNSSQFFLSSMKKNLFESEFPRYLALILKIDSFTQKMTENLKHTVKLIAIFLDYARESALTMPKTDLDNSITIKNVKSHFLVKDFPAKLNILVKNKALADLKPSLLIILNKLEDLGSILEPIDPNKINDIALDKKASSSNADNLMKIESSGDSYAKKKQDRIKKQFLEKQNLFLQKNNINVENLNEEAVCYFCHGDMQDPKEIFGVYCYVSEDNLIEYCQKNERGLRGLRPKASTITNTNSKTPILSITSCMHYIHKSCGEKSLANNIKIINEKKYLFSSITESLCGSCRCLSNIFLSIVEDKFNFMTHQTFPASDHLSEEILLADSFLKFMLEGNKPESSKKSKYLNPDHSESFWHGCSEFFDMLLRHFMMMEEYSECLSQENFILNIVQNMLGVAADNITLTGFMSYLRKGRTLYRNLYLMFSEYFWNFSSAGNTPKNASPSKSDGKASKQSSPEKIITEANITETPLIKKLNEKLRILFVRGDLRDVIDINEFDRIFHRTLWEVAVYLKDNEEHKFITMKLLSRHVYKLLLAYYCFVHTPEESSKNLEIFHNLLKLKEDFQALVAANMIHFSRRVLGVFLTTFRVEEKELFNNLDPDNFGSDLEELQYHVKVLPGVFDLNFDGDFNNEAISEWVNKLFIMKKMHNLAKENLLTAYALNLHLLSLAKNFADFHYKYVQELCKMCSGFPIHGDAYICLICEELLCSVTCSKTADNSSQSLSIGNLNIHTHLAHSGKCVFMNIQTALVIVIGTPKSIAFSHIYKDQYNQSINSQRNADFRKYNLDFKLYNRLQDIVIYKRIPQEICYRLMDNKDCIIKRDFL